MTIDRFCNIVIAVAPMAIPAAVIVKPLSCVLLVFVAAEVSFFLLLLLCSL